MALPSFDPSEEERKLWLSGVPFVVLLVALVAMCIAIAIGRRMDKNAEKE